MHLYTLDRRGAAGDAVDLDQRAEGERGYANRGARGPAVKRGTGGTGRDERCIVALEAGQIGPALHDMLEVEAELAEDQGKVVHHPAGLSGDALGQGRVRRLRIGRHLAGEDHPPVGFDSMTERGDRARGPRARRWNSGIRQPPCSAQRVAPAP